MAHNDDSKTLMVVISKIKNRVQSTGELKNGFNVFYWAQNRRETTALVDERGTIAKKTYESLSEDVDLISCDVANPDGTGLSDKVTTIACAMY